MSARAIWKGHLSIGDLGCAVALYSAVNGAERTAFHIINRDTGHRVRREYVDEDSGRPVGKDDLVKGYDTPEGQTVILEPDEIRDAVPESDKRLELSAFLSCDQIDTLYLERPYFLAPADRRSVEAYELIRATMEAEGVAAIARTVLFRRVRSVLVRPHGKGLIATTLNYDYEVRDAAESFEDISKVKIEKEMLDLARHIIGTKMGEFDPSQYEDRYEAALTELVKAKIAGRKPKKLPKRKPENVTSLLDALRKSAGATEKASSSKRKASTGSAAKQKKAS
ncbi:non-homologous end joining protein Ku [Rhizobium rosettiformans]|uniref:non-homologous end joining protein Ku n=1 Tax=Rhizobium rosettiformans TaxID=1368430 RepID=UPI002859065E|nr:Ku protein [Rhizobium rosettiformans]MDR7028548.1 DNA end-binding protein Ku [Rhizobium rosettiformans]MDR7064170.1 DNA end-binding protein Ku [Rhizobium rosettiformans]